MKPNFTRPSPLEGRAVVAPARDLVPVIGEARRLGQRSRELGVLHALDPVAAGIAHPGEEAAVREAQHARAVLRAGREQCRVRRRAVVDDQREVDEAAPAGRRRGARGGVLLEEELRVADGQPAVDLARAQALDEEAVLRLDVGHRADDARVRHAAEARRHERDLEPVGVAQALRLAQALARDPELAVARDSRPRHRLRERLHLELARRELEEDLLVGRAVAQALEARETELRAVELPLLRPVVREEARIEQAARELPAPHAAACGRLRKRARLSRMIAFTWSSGMPLSCASMYWPGKASPSPCGKSEPKTIGSIPISATTRCTFSSGKGATMKCSLKIWLGRRSRLPQRALRPIRKAWSILRSVYGSHTVPCSAMQTWMLGKRPKRLCRTMPATVSIAGRSPQ